MNKEKIEIVTINNSSEKFRFLLSFFAFSIIFAAFGAYGILVFSEICINSTEMLGSNSIGFFATKGSAKIVAINIDAWKITENSIPKEKLFIPLGKPLNATLCNKFISLYMVQILRQL